MIDIELLRVYCLSKKDASECFPFDDVTLVFKVLGKMFAVIPLDTPDIIILKCNPEYALELRERHSGIEGAFHFNKKYWNQVSLRGDIPLDDIFGMVDHSLDEVIAKLPKRVQAAYRADCRSKV